MAADVRHEIHASDTECRNIHLTQGTLKSGEDLEADSVLELVKRLDMGIAYSSEKLLNLELCITSVSLGKSNLPAESDTASEEQAEKILVLDLSLCYLDSELIELGNFLVSLRVEVVDVHEKASLCGKLGEILTLRQEKLQHAEASLKKTHEKLLEIKEQFGPLHRIILGFAPTSSYMAAEENFEAFKLDTVEHKKLLLRMLDKSIAEQVHLEKKLLETKQSKEELRSKLYIADQALSSMEETMEPTLLGLLEAENSVELFKGIAREMVSWLQILHFRLNGSLKRADELIAKILIKETPFLKRGCYCARPQLGQIVNGGIDHENATYFDELNGLAKKIKILEKDLAESESKLRRADLSDEAGQVHQKIPEMENLIESLRHSLFVAETRADSVEAKLAELTETHLELTEELGFLKGGESGREKISLLEKQVTDLKKQLLDAKALSEASQNQQNMLYSAILDMESMIVDLKSKVSEAEIKLENAEDRCLVLAESNSELNKEICLLKSRSESLEASLEEANRVEVARAKDINGGAKIITDMVMRLAMEREKIQKQLYFLARENRILMGELRRIRKNGSETTRNNKVVTDKGTCYSVNNVASGTSAPAEKSPETSSASNQVNEPLEAEMSSEPDEGSSTSPDQCVSQNRRLLRGMKVNEGVKIGEEGS